MTTRLEQFLLNNLEAWGFIPGEKVFVGDVDNKTDYILIKFVNSFRQSRAYIRTNNSLNNTKYTIFVFDTDYLSCVETSKLIYNKFEMIQYDVSYGIYNIETSNLSFVGKIDSAYLFSIDILAIIEEE